MKYSFSFFKLLKSVTQKRILCFVAVFCLVGTLHQVEGFNMLPPIMDNIDLIENPTGRSNTEEEALLRLQAHMLNELFIGPIMNDEAIKLLTKDEDEEEPIVPLDMEMHNNMLGQLIAKKLAKDDMLKLSKIMKRQGLVASDLAGIGAQN